MPIAYSTNPGWSKKVGVVKCTENPQGPNTTISDTGANMLMRHLPLWRTWRFSKRFKNIPGEWEGSMMHCLRAIVDLDVSVKTKL